MNQLRQDESLEYINLSVEYMKLSLYASASEEQW